MVRSTTPESAVHALPTGQSSQTFLAKVRCILGPWTLVIWLGAILQGLVPIAAAAQTPDTVPERPVEPLFTERDAWIAGGFVLGTAALAPLDIAIADAIQDSVIQVDRVLRGGAGVFRWLGFPGVVLVSGGLYAGGWLADQPELADMGFHTTQAILVAEAVTITAKALVGRARPKLNTKDPYNLDLFRGFTHDNYQSFPSGHSTAAFATAAALTTEIARHHPEAKWWVGTLMFTGATLMAVSRMYHNEHWASDVVAGAAIGSFGGWKVVRYMHTHPENRLNRWFLPRAALPKSSGGLVLLWSATP
jgi:membrane-associated phospholipid phosphatase